VATLVASTADTKAATSAAMDFAAAITDVMRHTKTPIFLTALANTKAAISGQIVASMLAIPPREANS
jgi:hypothetical protein